MYITDKKVSQKNIQSQELNMPPTCLIGVISKGVSALRNRVDAG